MKRILITLAVFLITFSPVYAGDFDSLMKQGNDFYNAGDYKQAEDYYTQAIQASPDKAKAYWYRGDCYFKRKMYVEAEKDLTRSIELDGTNPDVYMQRGNTFYNRNIFPEALKDYTRAIDLDQQKGIYWLYRGDCYRKMGMKDKAVEDYTEAERIGNKDATVYLAELKSEPAKSSNISNNVRIEPFTGAVFRSTGITFTDVEIAPEKENAYFTGNNVPLRYPLVVKMQKPGGLVKDKDGNVFLGAGFGVYETDGKELGKADDIYKDSTGLPGMYLSSLSMTVQFSKPMADGKEYILKLWFFDKKGTGRIDISMPIRISATPSTSKSISTGDSMLGPGIMTSAVNASVEAVTLVEKDLPVSFDALSPDSMYTLVLKGMKNCDADSYTAAFIEESGVSIKAGEGKLLPSANLPCVISTKGLGKKQYYLRVRVEGKTGGSIYCIVIPVTVK